MGISYHSVNDTKMEKLDYFFPHKNAFIEVNPGGCVLPRGYVTIGDKITNLEVKEDDVWLVSFPRTGSTWAQEMVWLLGHNLDFEGAKLIQQARAPILELTAIFSNDHDEWLSETVGNSVDSVEKMESPRYIRSHLPWSILPTQIEEVKPKIIYCTRNPKDLCVSFYYYCKLTHGMDGPFDEFCEMFLQESNPMGSFWNHVLSFWERRNESNILFLKYEDMKRDLPGCIRECAQFLGVPPLSESDMERLCDYLKFEKMQLNPAVNLEPVINYRNEQMENGDPNKKFIRKGQVGDWKNYISPEMSARFDEWIRLRTCGTGLEFTYE